MRCARVGRKLYDSHVPTTLAQKAVLGAAASVLALLDPTRTEQVAVPRFRHATNRHRWRVWATSAAGLRCGGCATACGCGARGTRRALCSARTQQHPEGQLVLRERPSLKDTVVRGTCFPAET